MALTLRLSKGSPLTHTELDDNFTYLSSSIASGGGTNLTISGSFAAERVIISGNTSSAAPGGLATTENIRVWVDNNGFAIGGSQGSNGVQGLGLVISETPSNGNHVILSDGSGSDLRLRAAGGDAGDTYVHILADQAGYSESDIFTIAKFGGPLRGTELYHTGSLVLHTTEIGANKAVVITGTVSASAEVYFSGLANTATPNIVGYDSTTGKLTYYSTASFGGGGGSTDYVSNVTLVGNDLTFTGVGNAFNSTVDLSPLTTNITSLNVFTGSANTRLSNLEAATGSYLTAADTGSFLYSGSYNSAASAITLYSVDANYTLDLSSLAGGGGGGFPITASNEGVDLTNSMSKIDFVGNAVTATNVGSIVTVTINTGSAASATDITALNNFTGSASTRLNTLEAATGSYVFSGSFDGANTLTLYSEDTNYSLDLSALIDAGTDITALNNFTGSANTRLDNLEAATSSFVTNDETGSFYYSSSISNNTITFHQGDGTTESVTVVSTVTASYSTTSSYSISASYYPLFVEETLTPASVKGVGTITFGNEATVTDLGNGIARVSIVSSSNAVTASYALTTTSASYAPNFYNSNGSINENRTVTIGSNSTILTYDLSTVAGARILVDTVSGATFKTTGSGGTQLDTATVSAAHLPNTATEYVLGYNTSNGNISYYSTSSILTNAFLQGGNSFSTTATLGTNDTQPLVFETNNQERGRITETGVTIVGNGVGALNTILNNSATTTNATPATLLTLATSTGFSYTVHAYVTGASITNGIGGEVIGAFKNISGTLTSVGSPVVTVIEDFSGSPTFTLTTSGTDIILQVTGQAATQINWAGSLRFVTVSIPVSEE